MAADFTCTHINIKKFAHGNSVFCTAELNGQIPDLKFVTNFIHLFIFLKLIMNFYLLIWRV